VTRDGDDARDEKRQEEITPYSFPPGDEAAGIEDCARCPGEGKVQVFEDRDGVRMPVGYRPCHCVSEATAIRLLDRGASQRSPRSQARW
jgi:hypothetical protein